MINFKSSNVKASVVIIQHPRNDANTKYNALEKLDFLVVRKGLVLRLI